MRALRKILIGLTLIGILLALWAFFLEPSSFRIHKERVAISEWPLACNGMTVAILADLHIGSPYKGLDSLADLVAKVNFEKPDLVLMPGDFVIQGVVGGNFIPPEDAAAILAKLQAPLGVFAVLGNHDWWLDASRVEHALAERGITVLEDASQQIGVKGCSLQLVGISDFWEGPHDIEKAMRDVRTDDYVLAFTHNPDIFPELPEQISLTIAGHTHGGQVHIPFVGRPVVPSAYGERYAIGHIVEEGRHLYVSSGVGTSILPVRFLVPPEVSFIEIHNENLLH